MIITKPDTYNVTNLNHKRVMEDLYKLTNRNISFGTFVDSKDQNISGKMVEITDTGVAGTINTITHKLGRIPQFIDIKYKSIAGDWFDAGTAWTVSQVFLKFTVDHMHVRVFVH